MKKTVKQYVNILKKVKSVCPKCNGKGKVKLDPCTCCNGKGYHTFDELVEGIECD